MSQPPLDLPEHPNTDSGSHPPFPQPEYLDSGRPPHPGYPQPSAAPPKKRKVGKIATIVLAAVGAALGSAVVNYAFKDHTDKTNDVQSSIQTHVVEPTTLDGRAKVVDPDLQAMADGMVAQMKKEIPQATGAISAFYGDPAKQDLVLIIGLSSHLTSPAAEVDQAITSMGSGGVKVTNVKAVAPGSLDGVAKCGDADLGEVPAGVCLWADHNTMGTIFIYFKSGDEAGAELVKLRGEIEQRD
ncbi:hypothetical protein Psi02_11970 [Planotetraspora silvatica]|uniref:Flagellar basal body-associated protein FliL n=1 Tax=Planotetraspora silvatica TaxID=234614 RepID=A0A8J3UFS8_9ACTN|nr:hypothetical protein [Planotetraspora silvatica]GII44773.1 hypothetical protein Psi02_11970 [Planotetraspora silvatica]